MWVESKSKFQPGQIFNAYSSTRVMSKPLTMGRPVPSNLRKKQPKQSSGTRKQSRGERKTMDEQVHDARHRKSTKKPPAELKDDDNYPTEDEDLRPVQKSRAAAKKSPPKGRQVDDLYSEDDDYIDQTDNKRRSSSNGDRGRSRSSPHSVSSTSSESHKVNDMREKKDLRRLDSASNRSTNGSIATKKVANMQDRLDKATKLSKKREQELAELQDEKERMQQELDRLAKQNQEAQKAFEYIRDNPQEIVKKAKLIGQKNNVKRRYIDVDGDDDYADEDGDGEQLTRDEHQLVQGSDMKGHGLSAVKKAFRTIKFINTDQQEDTFCDIVMNNIGKEELLYFPSDSDERKALVSKTRNKFKETYKGFWLKSFNSWRTYTQQRTKDGLFQWMDTSGRVKLPSPKLLRECIMTRDCSKFEPNDDDTDQQKEEKRRDMAEFEDVMDLYTEVLVPATAGAKLFHPKIRHFETMTTSLLPNTSGEALRITASTEAMTVLNYINGYKKWIPMYKWHKENPNGSQNHCPRWSSKRPNENLEFKAKYSDSIVAKPSWGGWSDEGKALYVTLQREVMASREENRERHIQEDQACVDRLYAKYKDLHKNSGSETKKQKTGKPAIRDDDPNFAYIVEI